MRKIHSVCIHALVLLALSITSQAAQQAKTVAGKVVGVADGDTITVLDSFNRQHKIRFQGIDAPESAQAFGQRSKQSLSEMVFGKQASILYEKLDKYGRVVGKVIVDGRDVNLLSDDISTPLKRLQKGRVKMEADVQDRPEVSSPLRSTEKEETQTRYASNDIIFKAKLSASARPLRPCRARSSPECVKRGRSCYS
jgi:hypothetical protein